LESVKNKQRTNTSDRCDEDEPTSTRDRYFESTVKLVLSMLSYIPFSVTLSNIAVVYMFNARPVVTADLAKNSI